MSGKPGSSAVPSALRAAMRVHLVDLLPDLIEIATGPQERSVDRIRAIELVAKFGLGAADQAAVHIHAEGGTVAVGVVALPALGSVGDPADMQLAVVTANEGELVVEEPVILATLPEGEPEADD